jgi:hypothetical protein
MILFSITTSQWLLVVFPGGKTDAFPKVPFRLSSVTKLLRSGADGNIFFRAGNPEHVESNARLAPADFRDAFSAMGRQAARADISPAQLFLFSADS